ncbi:glycosyltransferase family 2 protein [Rhizobium sp. WYJ-E13]|uniref:glycosyltransferase family 2 protein n=1 Tax=Rhizobium sp. WYJ-E13 TaxID=2849093 RepID=UPI001C1F192E|nr:glycosyltransferase family 2 protein [Rhizobium sp. WYJ-E13]QWW71899.1 glycosyltransferase [Rhizobium sp. WYJ-E13]
MSQPVDKPEISVVIAAFQCASFVRRAIDSALSQQGVSLEVIVVDDCSKDETLNVLNAIAKLDDRVRVISLSKNGGPSKARNAGFEAATSDWVAVLDADDAYLPGRLFRMLNFARENNADIVADNFLYFDLAADEMGKPALKTSPESELITLEVFVERSRPYADEADYGLLKPMFRRQFLEERGLKYPTDLRHGEDFVFYLDVLSSGAIFYLSRYPGYAYTTRNSGLSRTEIDYSKQIRVANDLCNDEKFSSFPNVRQHMWMRKVSLERLQIERRYRSIEVGNIFIEKLKFLTMNIGGSRVLLPLIVRDLKKFIKSMVLRRGRAI